MITRKTGLGVIVGITVALAAIAPILAPQAAEALVDMGEFRKAPIAASGDNVCIAWWSNKTGNDEVMFKASADGGKTFADKMNLSNSSESESQDVQIAAAGNNVYVTWWERANQTSNEPVLRISNDNGKTFGEKIMLSSNATSGSNTR
jgi:hypothetical protein